jgi:hypothetical protein
VLFRSSEDFAAIEPDVTIINDGSVDELEAKLAFALQAVRLAPHVPKRRLMAAE